MMPIFKTKVGFLRQLMVTFNDKKQTSEHHTGVFCGWNGCTEPEETREYIGYGDVCGTAFKDLYISCDTSKRKNQIEKWFATDKVKDNRYYKLFPEMIALHSLQNADPYDGFGGEGNFDGLTESDIKALFKENHLNYEAEYEHLADYKQGQDLDAPPVSVDPTATNTPPQDISCEEDDCVDSAPADTIKQPTIEPEVVEVRAAPVEEPSTPAVVSNDVSVLNTPDKNTASSALNSGQYADQKIRAYHVLTNVETPTKEPLSLVHIASALLVQHGYQPSRMAVAQLKEAMRGLVVLGSLKKDSRGKLSQMNGVALKTYQDALNAMMKTYIDNPSHKKYLTQL